MTIIFLFCHAAAILGAETQDRSGGFIGQVRRRVALKTNMLYDAALTPNIAMEVALSRRWAVSADWLYAWWSRDSSHRYWRVYGGGVEGRFYPFLSGGDRLMTGHHFGVSLSAFTYDFEFGGAGQQSARWNYSVAVGYGYSLEISRWFDIDFSLYAGFVAGKYYKYKPIDGHYVWQSTNRRRYIGPTKVEVSLKWFLTPRPARR